MLKSKKILLILLVLTLVFTFSMNALADSIPAPGGPDSPTVLTTPVSNTSIDVTFVIEAGDAFDGMSFTPIPGTAFRKEIPVTLTSDPAKAFTVADLLIEVDGTNDLDFDLGSDPQHDSMLMSVTYDGTLWDSGNWALDGWVFRLNNKYPVEVDGEDYQGTVIGDTYLDDGDVVHFFFDFPSDFSADTGNVAAEFVRAIPAEAGSSDAPAVQLQGHKTYINQHQKFEMSVYNYTNLGAGVTAYLYDASDVLLDTAASDASGVVTFDVTPVSGQKYIVKTDSVLNSFEGSFWAYYIKDVYFVRTGAYSVVTFGTEPEPEPEVVSVTPTASVESHGATNNLFITVTELMSDGSANDYTDTYVINVNAAGTYNVGPYQVYVETIYNTQIREINIVSGPHEITVTPKASIESHGATNNLTITVSEFILGGEGNTYTDTYVINVNTAGTYNVGPYQVYVDTMYNTQIREIYIASGPHEITVTPKASVESHGATNNLTITVSEFILGGEGNTYTDTFVIDVNSAGTYNVGPYQVYVDTMYNTQIREIYIVE